MKTLNEIIAENDEPSETIILDHEILEFLIEEEEQKRVAHLDHAEDALVRGNGRGFHDMLSALSHTHDYLSGGRRRPNYALSMKMDGSPSIVFGHDPNNSKFFVGTNMIFQQATQGQLQGHRHRRQPREPAGVGRQIESIIKTFAQDCSQEGGVPRRSDVHW